MARLAITGASGFVGRALVAHAKHAGHSVRSMSRGAFTGEGDSALAGIDCVVHLAARAHILKEEAADPLSEFRAANVTFTQRVANAAIAARVPRFVFMSSAGVLGLHSPDGGFHEDSPPDPHDAYSQTKLEAELWLKQQARGSIDVVTLRPPLVYGPGARGNFGRILRAAASRWPLPVGGIHAPRSMIGLRNLLDSICHVGLHAASAGQTMLVSDGRAMSVAELTKLLRTLLGNPAPVVAIPTGLLVGMLGLIGRSRDASRLAQPFLVRATRARELTGWKPPHSVEEELKWTVAK
jgi:nucleoside-diphosphate-sugar epimerase